MRDYNSVHPLLLVEDEEDHARLIMRALKEKGRLLNQIVWVQNGLEAVQYLSHEAPFNQPEHVMPAIMLLDIKLPLMDGFEVLQFVKSKPHLQTLPVVMLTTSSNCDDVRRALQLGANDFIVKPVQFSDFVEKVGKLGHYWMFISDSGKAVDS